jgi:hypothetical protein
MKRLVRDLRPGDRVDLEHDKYAMLGAEELPDAFSFEYEVVDSLDPKTPKCTAVYFESGRCIGFPPDHSVPVEPSAAITLINPCEPGPICVELAASLACYCSNDDYRESRRKFLENVRDRITADLESVTTEHTASWWIIGRDNKHSTAYVAVDIHNKNGTLLSEGTWTSPLGHTGMTAAEKIARDHAKTFGVEPKHVYYDPDSTETFAKC